MLELTPLFCDQCRGKTHRLTNIGGDRLVCDGCKPVQTKVVYGDNRKEVQG